MISAAKKGEAGREFFPPNRDSSASISEMVLVNPTGRMMPSIYSLLYVLYVGYSSSSSSSRRFFRIAHEDERRTNSSEALEIKKEKQTGLVGRVHNDH